MGGSVFSSGAAPLWTPRIPRPVYEAARERCAGVLSGLYRCVGTPIEGPAKDDFGDVDMVVACPRDGRNMSTREAVDGMAASLGATRVVFREKAPSSLAIPWPDTAATAADADAGSIMRPYGLTIDGRALWLRVPDIEAVDRARAKVQLSTDPDHVLAFLGLPPARFWQGPFARADDLFEYAARCHLFWVPLLAASAVGDGGDDCDNDDDSESAARASHRRRRLRQLRQRPVFQRWVQDFVPRCRAAGDEPPVAA